MGGGSAPSVPQQDLGKELGQVLQYLPKFTQKQFDLSGTFGPQFTQQDLALSKWAAPAYAQQGLDLTKQFGPQYAQAGLDVANKFAPQYLGLNQAQMQKAIAGSPLLSSINQQALAGLKSGGVTPFLSNLSDAAKTGLAGAYSNLARGGVDPLLAQATTQAQQGLTLGGAVSPQEQRQVTQNTLAGFAARGNAGGNQALAQEFLNRDIYSRGRQQERQQYATGVEAQRQGALGQAQQFSLGTQGALQSALGQAQQYGLSAQGIDQAALQGLGGVVTPPNFASYAQAPNLAAYGAPGASNIPMGAGLGVTMGQTQPLLNFGQNLFDANQNAAATQNIAAANKSGGLTGAGIGAAGAIGGGLLAAL